MLRPPKKRKPVIIYYGPQNALCWPNLTKGEALKIAAELLQEYEQVTIKIQNNEPDKKP